MNTINQIVARAARLAMLALIVAASMAQAQTLDEAGAEPDAADTQGRATADSHFLSGINPGVIKEFERAWRISNAGITGHEGVVLIFRMADGSYTGKTQRPSPEYKQFTFKWDPAARAIVHTHPNSSGPRPSLQDKQVAKKYGVPIFTITLKGMYVYNPATRKTRQVMDGLAWLRPSEWQKATAKLKGSGPQSIESCY